MTNMDNGLKMSSGQDQLIAIILRNERMVREEEDDREGVEVETEGMEMGMGTGQETMGIL